jgi:multiple sugar transport system ATP-binding protein
MADILCTNINKKYGETEVVADFNLHIKDHEFVVLLGPSGCGKSTILRMIAGLEDISGGELHIGDKLVNDAEPGDRGIAMVFQNYALYPHMSVRENIAFGLRRLKRPEEEISQRIEKVSDMLGLAPVLARKPAELSGGQQQRVAIARAMIKTPDVFLFDEPLSNLDAQLRTQMRSEIHRLHKDLKTTSVYVTHDQMEAMTLADRIVLLKAGQIEQVGSPEEIFVYPETLFAAKFIGTPSMNLLPMTTKKTSDGWAFENGQCRLNISGENFSLTDGKKVVLGVRPSDLAAQSLAKGDNIVSGISDFVEFHGDQALVSFNIGASSIRAFVPAKQRPKEGVQVIFKVDDTAIHLFDPETEKTLRK